MKILKELKTGNLLKTTNEEAAKKVKTGAFVYSTKGRFKSVLKDLKKISNRPKTPPARFNSGRERKTFAKLAANYKPVYKIDKETGEATEEIKEYKKKLSTKRDEQLQAEARNKKSRR
jgi:hypothetical protein